MIDKCYDEGTIQAFLDGELETDTLEAVARHTASCDACSLLLADAEEESSFAFSALGDEFNSLVPTERIRTNLYQAISQMEKPGKSFWSRIFGGFSLSSPSIVAFASLLLVVGLFTTLYIHRESGNVQNPEIASSNEQPKLTTNSRLSQPVSTNPVSSTDDEVGKADDGEDNAPIVQQPLYKRPAENQPRYERADYRVVKTPAGSRRPETIVDSPRNTLDQALPGEETYVKTIATLTDNVNSRKDIILRPSERVAFEKDLAVVNDAIDKMQKEVRKNPKNEAAKQVLRSTYQNKIDLLNSVAEKQELMATLR